MKVFKVTIVEYQRNEASILVAAENKEELKRALEYPDALSNVAHERNEWFPDYKYIPDTEVGDIEEVEDIEPDNGDVLVKISDGVASEQR